MIIIYFFHRSRVVNEVLYSGAINMSQLIGQILFYSYINRQSADEFGVKIKLAALSREADGLSTRVGCDHRARIHGANDATPHKADKGEWRRSNHFNLQCDALQFYIASLAEPNRTFYLLMHLCPTLKHSCETSLVAAGEVT